MTTELCTIQVDVQALALDANIRFATVYNTSLIVAVITLTAKVY